MTLQLTNLNQMVLSTFTISWCPTQSKWPLTLSLMICFTWTHSLSQSFSAMHLFLFTADLSMCTASYSVVTLMLTGAHSFSPGSELDSSHWTCQQWQYCTLTLWCLSYSVLLVVWFHSQSGWAITLQSSWFVLSQQGLGQGSEVIIVVFG